MVRVYYYLFFRLYAFAKWVSTGQEEWTAMLFVSILNYFNLATIVFWIFPVEKVVIFPVWTMAVIICVPLGLINYFVLLHKGEAQMIISKFEQESKSQKVISSVLTLIYIVVTLVLAHK